MDRVAKRAREIPPFIVMDVLERAHELEREGRHIIHLEIGEPDFATPQCICEAAQEAIQKGETHYTHSLGIIELREAICEDYHTKYGVNVDPRQILVTSGTSPALFMIFSALLETDDEIIFSDPHYPCYPNFANFLKAKPVLVKGYEEDGFQLRPSEIKKKIGPSTKAVLINSPSNPTGNLLSHERMKKIAELGPPVISDEIYHGLVYREKEHYDRMATWLSHCSFRLYPPLAKSPAEFLYISGQYLPVGRSGSPQKGRTGCGTDESRIRRTAQVHDPKGPGDGIRSSCGTCGRLLHASQCKTS